VLQPITLPRAPADDGDKINYNNAIQIQDKIKFIFTQANASLLA
jgi:hypothetical protein